MNLLYNKNFLVVCLFLVLGLFCASIVNLFLKNDTIALNANNISVNEYSSKLSSKLRLENKELVFKEEKKVVEEVFLLREFILNGTVTGAIKAVIIENKGKGEYVFLNDLYEGYKLIDVAKNKAIFEKNSKKYTLYLYKEMQELYAQKSDSSSSSSSTKRKKVVIKSRQMFGDIKKDGDNYFIPRALVREYMNLSVLSSQMHFVAASSNGKKYFFVKNMNSNGIFPKLGFKISDKVLKIDGKEFKSFTEPFKLLNNAKSLSNLSLTIERKGEIKELKYEIY